MLGVYDYTVVLTYVSLMVSIGGMMFAVNGHLHLGVMCLAISGLCDMFDGKIARTKKNRTEVEKRFAILMFYVLAGLIRLAWFNVMEEQRQEETTEKRECYQGLPITSMAIALPLVVVLKPFLGCEFMLALHVVMLVVGILFITNFKLKKPKNVTMGAIVAVVAMAVIAILVRHYMRYMSMM